MKVIFIKDLIKNGYAVQVTEKSMNNYEKEKKQEQELFDAKKEEALKIKEELEKITLLFKVKTGEHDKVFGSISAKQIKDELHKKGFKIDKRQIELTTSLACLGFHNVKVNLFKEVTATLKVQLVK